jgi:hypothetical protein
VIVAELDDVHYDLEVDGELVRRQLARQLWEQRGWATVAIVFEERDRSGAWTAPKLALLRLRRVHDAWKRHAQITLPAPTALALADTLAGWRDRFGTAETDDDDDA